MSKLRRRKENARTRRTQQRLLKYSEAMGYSQYASSYGFVVVEHKKTGYRVEVPDTVKRDMTAREWHETYKALIMGATLPSGMSREQSPGSTEGEGG